MADSRKAALIIFAVALACGVLVAAGIARADAASAQAERNLAVFLIGGVGLLSLVAGWLFATDELTPRKGLGAVALGVGLYFVYWAGYQAPAQESWWKRPAIMACCSDADAVFADEWRILPDGSIVARVTGGGPRGHTWAPVGREYTVPKDKVRDREGNPIGRPLLFLNPYNLEHVYCFVPGVMI